METIIPEIRRYPIGRFTRPESYHPQSVASAIASIEGLPRKILAHVSNLSRADCERQYRPGSWTVRQVVNHIVDANVNNYARFKFALTEDNPIIKPYLEDRWSDLADARSGELRPSLELISGIHGKWVQTLRTMGDAEFGRTFHHPMLDRDVPLFEAVSMYAWHGEHHLSHIRLALDK